MTIPLEQAKADLEALIERSAAGEEVVITRDGRPVARVVSAPARQGGANDGARPEYRGAAVALGRAIARRGLTLVYGGGAIGLMGAVADGALAAEGKVVGIITKLLHGREVAHRRLTRLDVVETMHDRK